MHCSGTCGSLSVSIYIREGVVSVSTIEHIKKCLYLVKCLLNVLAIIASPAIINGGGSTLTTKAHSRPTG